MSTQGRESEMVIFSLYSYLEKILSFFVNCFPWFIRNIFYLLTFKKYGKKSFIDHDTYFRYPWKIEVGSFVSINRGSQFYASMHDAKTNIVIGDHVAIGPNVKIYTATHEHSTIELKDMAKTVQIKEHCWIGGDAIILPGVIIGKGSVVGAGSVVTKSIPSFSIVVGNPAKIIKKRVLSEII